MVDMLAQAFEMPLRDCNAFLHAAGFAPMYRETPLHAPPLGPVRDAVELLLRSIEPYPTFVLNRRADILQTNETGQWLLATFNEDLGAMARPYNIARLFASPKGNRAYIENWEEVARMSLARLRRELGGAHVRDPADDELLKTANSTWAKLGDPPDSSAPLPLLITVRFRRGKLALNLFSTHATLGTQFDVTLQELRVEMFFPADEHSKRVLEDRRAHALAASDAATPPGAAAARQAPRTRRSPRRPGRAATAARHDPRR